VEREILNVLPPSAESLLDVGAGDGSRARRIATAGGIPNTTLVEPAEGMLSLNDAQVKTLALRAEDCTARARQLASALAKALGRVFS